MTKLDYQIKTHKIGRVYNQPHFYVLNKGLNSGRAFNNPIPNCFVVTTNTDEQRESLFYLCLALHTGRYFNFYIIGSVIPFIRINDTRKAIDIALQNYEKHQWKVKVEKLKKIIAYEINLQEQSKIIAQLKLALLRT